MTMKKLLIAFLLALPFLALAQPVSSTITSDGSVVTVATPVNTKLIPVCNFEWIIVDGVLRIWITGSNEIVPGGRLKYFTVSGVTDNSLKDEALGAISDGCDMGGGGNGIFGGGGTTPSNVQVAMTDSLVFDAGSLKVDATTNTVSMIGNVVLPNTTASAGIVYKLADRWLHNFAPTGSTSFNTFLGVNSGNFTMTGSGSIGNHNVGIGDNTLTSLTTGESNTTVGQGSMNANTTGVQNTAIGRNAFSVNQTGSDNTAIGYASLTTATNRSQNTAVGASALRFNTSTNNTVVGAKAGDATTNGYGNTLVGANAGGVFTTGDFNTVVGDSAYMSSTNYSNTTVIGNRAEPTASNQVVLGNSSVTQLKSGNYAFNIDQTVGAGQDNYVLTYDNGTGEIGLEVAAGGSSYTASNGIGLNTADFRLGGTYFLNHPSEFSSSRKLNLGNFLTYIGTDNADSLNTFRFDVPNKTIWSSQFTVNVGIGTGTDASLAFGDEDTGWYESTDDVLNFTIGGNKSVTYNLGGGDLRVNYDAGTVLGWSSTSDPAGTTDTRVTRDGAGLLQVKSSDAVTNAVTATLELNHQTSGTAAVGFGSSLRTELENASGTDIGASTIETLWSDATNATEDATITIRSVRAGSMSDKLSILSTGHVVTTAPLRLMGYTVAGLPAGVVGDMAYVTDALAPAYLVTVTGGGAVTTPVFFDGANWVAH